MIDRKLIDALPTLARDNIASHFKRLAEQAGREAVSASATYVRTDNPVHRSAALYAAAQEEAFLAVYSIFK